MADHCDQGEHFMPDSWTSDQKWNLIRSVLIGRAAVEIRRSRDGDGYCLRSVAAGQGTDSG